MPVCAHTLTEIRGSRKLRLEALGLAPKLESSNYSRPKLPIVKLADMAGMVLYISSPSKADVASSFATGFKDHGSTLVKFSLHFPLKLIQNQCCKVLLPSLFQQLSSTPPGASHVFPGCFKNSIVLPMLPNQGVDSSQRHPQFRVQSDILCIRKDWFRP